MRALSALKVPAPLSSQIKVVPEPTKFPLSIETRPFTTVAKAFSASISRMEISASAPTERWPLFGRPKARAPFRLAFTAYSVRERAPEFNEKQNHFQQSRYADNNRRLLRRNPQRREPSALLPLPTKTAHCGIDAETADTFRCVLRASQY